MKFKASFNIGAKFKLIKRKKSDDSIVEETGWTKNLVLNSGLNRMSEGTWISMCCVGTGNSEPDVAQTKLDNFLASTSYVLESTQGVNYTNAPLYTWVRRTWRFDEGDAEGNVSEVGLGWSPENLWNRALIKDLNDDPTTITIFDDEYLDVVSEIRMQFTQSFSGSVDMVDKMGDVLSHHTYNGIALMRSGGHSFGRVSFYEVSVYSGVLQDLITTPNGSLGKLTNFVQTNENPRSVTLRARAPLPSILGNHRSFVALFSGLLSPHQGGYSGYQVQIDPPIPKTNEDILEYEFTLSWNRL